MNWLDFEVEGLKANLTIRRNVVKNTFRIAFYQRTSSDDNLN